MCKLLQRNVWETYPNPVVDSRFICVPPTPCPGHHGGMLLIQFSAPAATTTADDRLPMFSNQQQLVLAPPAAGGEMGEVSTVYIRTSWLGPCHSLRPLTSAARSPTTSIRRRSLLLDGWTSIIFSSNLTDFLQPSLNTSLVCPRRIELLDGWRVRSIECVRAIDTCRILLRNIGSIAYLRSAPGAGRGGHWCPPTSYGPLHSAINLQYIQFATVSSDEVSYSHKVWISWDKADAQTFVFTSYFPNVLRWIQDLGMKNNYGSN